jgi:hypothetical protein
MNRGYEVGELHDAEMPIDTTVVSMLNHTPFASRMRATTRSLDGGISPRKQVPIGQSGDNGGWCNWLKPGDGGAARVQLSSMARSAMSGGPACFSPPMTPMTAPPVASLVSPPSTCGVGPFSTTCNSGMLGGTSDKIGEGASSDRAILTLSDGELYIPLFQFRLGILDPHIVYLILVRVIRFRLESYYVSTFVCSSTSRSSRV